MFCGVGKLCVAAIAVVGVFVLSPAAALADGCQGGTSAVNIYSECIPTASGGTHHNRGGHRATTPSVQTPTPPPVVPVTPVKPRQKPKHVDPPKTTPKPHVTDPSLVATRAIAASASYPVTTPNAVSSVFDIGSEPTALFAMLAVAAIVLLGFGGLRGRRQKL